MCLLLGILELRKDTNATVLQTKSILCLLISRSLNLFHISLHKIQLLHRNLSLFHSLFHYLHLLLYWYFFASVNNRQSHLHQNLFGISDTTTLTGQKFLPLNQFRSTPPVEGPSSQPSTPPSDLDVHIALAKVNSFVLIILFLILFSMIVLIPLFASLFCLCLLHLYEKVWYLPKSMLWTRRWMFLVSRGTWELVFAPLILLWVVAGSIPRSITRMALWIDIKLDLR